jgi:hypothetical protein
MSFSRFLHVPSQKNLFFFEYVTVSLNIYKISKISAGEIVIKAVNQGADGKNFPRKFMVQVLCVLCNWVRRRVRDYFTIDLHPTSTPAPPTVFYCQRSHRGRWFYLWQTTNTVLKMPRCFDF